MLRDDFLMRQIQKVADMIAAAFGDRSGEPLDDPERRLDEAEDELFTARGLDRDLVGQLGPRSVAQLLGPERSRLLVQIVAARAKLDVLRGGDGARLHARALALLDATVAHAGARAEDESLIASLRSLDAP
jgi:hypothetical protein